MKRYGSNSFHRGDLPEGCLRCIRGEKMVLFATGSCGVGCYYCTISEDRTGNSIYVNELSVDLENELNDIFKESQTMMASGCGITGGDPLVRPERVLHYIKSLKKQFGEDYHIHLYTSGQYLNMDLVDRLWNAGLDELRIHPKEIDEYSIWELTSKIKRTYPELIVGFEVPAIPEKTTELHSLIQFANNNNLDFVNLNEFEFTPSNFSKLDTRGFQTILSGAAVVGSAEMVEDLISGLDHTIKVPVHFCSSASKDSIQLVQRYKRRASQIARPFESISDEGELEYGRFVVSSSDKYEQLVSLLQNEFQIPGYLIDPNPNMNTIETAWLIVEELVDELRNHLPDLEAQIISRHPVENGPITYLNPL